VSKFFSLPEILNQISRFTLQPQNKKLITSRIRIKQLFTMQEIKPIVKMLCWKKKLWALQNIEAQGCGPAYPVSGLTLIKSNNKKDKIKILDSLSKWMINIEVRGKYSSIATTALLRHEIQPSLSLIISCSCSIARIVPLCLCFQWSSSLSL
jgi:hypothetical protein